MVDYSGKLEVVDDADYVEANGLINFLAMECFVHKCVYVLLVLF